MEFAAAIRLPRVEVEGSLLYGDLIVRVDILHHQKSVCLTTIGRTNSKQAATAIKLQF